MKWSNSISYDLDTNGTLIVNSGDAVDCVIERGIAVGEESADLPAVSEEELSAVHEESAPVAGQSPERMEVDSVQDEQEGEDNVREAMTREQGEKEIEQPTMLSSTVFPANLVAPVCNLQQFSTAADCSLAELPTSGMTLNIAR